MVHYIRDMQKCTVYSRHGSRHLVVMPGKHDCGPPAWANVSNALPTIQSALCKHVLHRYKHRAGNFGEATRDGDSCVKPKPGGTRQPSLDTVPVSSVTT